MVCDSDPTISALVNKVLGRRLTTVLFAEALVRVTI